MQVGHNVVMVMTDLGDGALSPWRSWELLPSFRWCLDIPPQREATQVTTAQSEGADREEERAQDGALWTTALRLHGSGANPFHVSWKQQPSGRTCQVANTGSGVDE